MKNALPVILAASLVATQADTRTKWAVDNVHSSVKFTVPHLVISEVEGSFNVYSGTIDSAAPDFANAAIEFAVDVNSISTGNEMRDTHLKSDDFFNAQKYPQMLFKSVSWKKTGENRYALEGNLTIRNITKRATFDAIYGGSTRDGYGNTKAGFKATAVINRFEYGLKWNALTEAGGMTVGKEVTITLRLEFTEQKAS
jgi:polyisoprenoid-binding protein YceI